LVYINQTANPVLSNLHSTRKCNFDKSLKEQAVVACLVFQTRLIKGQEMNYSQLTQAQRYKLVVTSLQVFAINLSFLNLYHSKHSARKS